MWILHVFVEDGETVRMLVSVELTDDRLGESKVSSSAVNVLITGIPIDDSVIVLGPAFEHRWSTSGNMGDNIDLFAILFGVFKLSDQPR
jgi:hypothetical protein